MGKNGQEQRTKHHLVPVSRCGDNRAENIRRIPASLHRAWHGIFANATPVECLHMLLDILPAGVVRHVTYRRPEDIDRRLHCRGPINLYGRSADLWRQIFPRPHPVLVLYEWSQNWVPRDYFEALSGVTHRNVFDLKQPLDPERFPQRKSVTPLHIAYLVAQQEGPAPYLGGPGRRGRAFSRPKPAEYKERWSFHRHFARTLEEEG